MTLVIPAPHEDPNRLAYWHTPEGRRRLRVRVLDALADEPGLLTPCTFWGSPLHAYSISAIQPLCLFTDDGGERGLLRQILLQLWIEGELVHGPIWPPDEDDWRWLLSPHGRTLARVLARQERTIERGGWEMCKAPGCVGGMNFWECGNDDCFEGTVTVLDSLRDEEWRWPCGCGDGYRSTPCHACKATGIELATPRDGRRPR
jgi:hypothetical protein